MSDDLSKHIALNLKRLRDARQVSQQRLSDLSGVPRPTLANLESGSANPTLSVMLRVSDALQVPLEELLRQPAPLLVHHRSSSLARKSRGRVNLQRLIADPKTGASFERVELSEGGRWALRASNPGRRHHLYCEGGQVLVTAATESCELCSGELAVVGSEVGLTATNAKKRIAVVFRVTVAGFTRRLSD